MTDELQSIRERHEAIIPGPWRWYGNTATDQVYLATTNRGRLFVLMPETRTTEHVFHHGYSESYELSSISNTQVREWCGAHDESGGDDGLRCICQELADFLRPHDHPEELGYQEFDERGVQLSRGVATHADLRFAVGFAGHGMEADEHRKRHGGMMRSYRSMPKYEVLGYRTISEWEMDSGGVENARNALYREDFCGLDNPEATFIEHAPEDIGWLLERVAWLEAEVLRLHRLLGQTQRPGGTS